VLGLELGLGLVSIRSGGIPLGSPSIKKMIFIFSIFLFLDQTIHIIKVQSSDIIIIIIMILLVKEFWSGLGWGVWGWDYLKSNWQISGAYGSKFPHPDLCAPHPFILLLVPFQAKLDSCGVMKALLRFWRICPWTFLYKSNTKKASCRIWHLSYTKDKCVEHFLRLIVADVVFWCWLLMFVFMKSF